jgi:hypothetical protein
MSRRNRGEDQNLDSLLDTMANVVGILIVLVAVTQLTVGDAVERIRAQGADREVSEEELATARAKRDRLDDALEEARLRWRNAADESRELAWLLDDAAPLIEELDALPDRDALHGLGIEELRALIADEQAMFDESTETESRLRSRVARLDDMIKDLPAETRPKVARLPDPRPPPSGTEELTFLCRHQRILPVDAQQMLRVLEESVWRALGTRRDYRALQWEDRPWLVNYFDKEQVWYDDLGWKLRDAEGDLFFADLRWRDPSLGETSHEVRIGGSDYAQVLRGESPKKRFVHFYVWSDSFDVYLEARYLAEKLGFAVSWMAVDSREQVGVELSGRARPRPTLLVD